LFFFKYFFLLLFGFLFNSFFLALFDKKFITDLFFKVIFIVKIYFYNFLVKSKALFNSNIFSQFLILLKINLNQRDKQYIPSPINISFQKFMGDDIYCLSRWFKLIFSNIKNCENMLELNNALDLTKKL
jgi:hypothetical protein